MLVEEYIKPITGAKPLSILDFKRSAKNPKWRGEWGEAKKRNP